MPSPLTGNIPITNGQGTVASSGWFAKGTDGEVFTVSGAQGISATYSKIGSAKINATAFTRSEAQWQSDFNTLVSGNPAAPTASDCAQGPIPIPGTNKWLMCGKGDGGSPSGIWSVGVIYEITDESTIAPWRAFAYRYTTDVGHMEGGLGTCWCFGSAVVDGELFAIVWLYNGIPLFDHQPGTYLVRLPLLAGGTIVETDMSVWATRRTYLGNRFGDVSGLPTYFLSAVYFNGCTILKHPANSTTVMVLTYRALASLPGGGSNLVTAGSEYVLVDYDAQTSGLLTSAQAELGQPWADDGLGFSGSPTANNQFNGYSGPSSGDGSGATARELMFSRPYVDAPTVCQTRGWHWDETTGLFTPAWVQQWSVATGDAFDLAAVAYRYAAGSPLVGGAKYTTGTWRLGSFSNGGRAGRRFVGKLGPVREIA